MHCSRTRSLTRSTIAVAAVAAALLGSGASTAAARSGHRAAALSATRITHARFGSVFGGLRLPHFGFGGFRGFGGSIAHAVVVGNGPFAVAVDQATHTAYVVNQYDGTVSVINTATCNALVTTTCAAAHPGLMTVDTSGNAGVIDAAVDQNTDTLYLVNLASNTISVVNGATCNASVSSGCGLVPPETITVSGTANAGTDGVAIDDATDTVYVANVNLDTVSVIDGATCNGTTTSGCGQTPATVTVGPGPTVPAVDEATDTVYVPNSGDGTVSVIDGAKCNASVITGCAITPAHLTVGGVPNAATVDEATDTVYVATPNVHGFGALAVINGATCNAAVSSGCGQTPATVPVGNNGDGVVVDPVTQSVFVVNQGDSTLSIIDGAICNALDTAGCAQHPPVVATGYFPGYMDIDVASDTIYVANNGANTVSVINGAACTLARPFACRHDPPTTTAGTIPQGSAIDSATGTLYVSNQDSDDVSVIDASSCSALVTVGCGRTWPTISTGSGTTPFAVAVDQQTDTVYIANNSSNTISVINGATCNAHVTSGCGQTPATVTVVPPGDGNPVGLDVDEATDTVYVVNTSDPNGTVAVVNGATCNGTVHSGCGQTPTLVTVGNVPLDDVVDQATNTVYVTNVADGDVSMIDGATCNAHVISSCGQMPQTIGNSGGWGIAVDEATDTVYTAGNPDGGLSVINGGTCNAINTSGCGQTPRALGAGSGPSEVTVDQASGRVYATSMFNSDVDVYSGAICNRTVTWGCGQTPLSVALGGNPGNPVFDPANQTLYVPDQSDDEVSYLFGWGF